MEQITQQIKNEIFARLYKLNFDQVRTRDEQDPYLVISKLATILKYNEFSKEEFDMLFRNCTTRTKEELDALWNRGNGEFTDLNYVYEITDQDVDLDILNSITFFDEIEEKEIEWLIPGFIPKGTITLISGDGGVGKGFAICNLIKRITNNEPAFFEDPDSFVPSDERSRYVFYFSSEDDVSSVLKKRMRMANINQKYLGTIEIKKKIFESIKYDSPILETIINLFHPQLMIFDPFQSFINENVNLSNRAQVRKAMNNLVRLGNEYGTTFMIVTHTNKSDKRSGRGRVADSADLWDVARSVFIVGKTNEEGQRYFSNEKNNYGKEQPTILYKIQDGKAVYDGISPYKDEYYVNNKVPAIQDQGDSLQSRCMNEILTILNENRGSVTTKELTDQLGSIYSDITIRRARDELKNTNKICYLRNQLLSDGKRGTIIQLVIN